jgi:glycine cleavage system H protein
VKDLITYLGYEWLSVDDGIVTIGVNEEGLAELSEITKVVLPAVDEEIEPDDVCGEIETDSGPLNLYSPVEGQVVEINEAVVEDPTLLTEDPFGDGWLFRVEAKNLEDLDELGTGTSGDRD